MNESEETLSINITRVGRSLITKATQKINAVKLYIQTEDITQANNLLRVITLLVEEKLQLKRIKNGGVKEP